MEHILVLGIIINCIRHCTIQLKRNSIANAIVCNVIIGSTNIIVVFSCKSLSCSSNILRIFLYFLDNFRLRTLWCYICFIVQNLYNISGLGIIYIIQRVILILYKIITIIQMRNIIGTCALC